MGYTNIKETKHEMRFFFKTLQPTLVLSETHQINENIYILFHYVKVSSKSTKEDCVYIQKLIATNSISSK